MKKIELKQYIKECIDEVLEEDQAFGESASNEINMLKRIDEVGPARIARQASGVHSQDQGRDPLARKNPGVNRLAKGATNKIVSFQRKSGKTASRDRRVPFKERPRVGSVKKIGEEKKYNANPPRTGLKPRPDDLHAVKKNSPMGAIEKVRRKLTGESEFGVKDSSGKKPKKMTLPSKMKGEWGVKQYTPKHRLQGEPYRGPKNPIVKPKTNVRKARERIGSMPKPQKWTSNIKFKTK